MRLLRLARLLRLLRLGAILTRLTQREREVPSGDAFRFEKIIERTELDPAPEKTETIIEFSEEDAEAIAARRSAPKGPEAAHP